MALINPILIILGLILLYINLGGAMAATALAFKTRSSATITGLPHLHFPASPLLFRPDEI